MNDVGPTPGDAAGTSGPATTAAGEAVLAALAAVGGGGGFSPLGMSRQGRPILGRVFSAPPGGKATGGKLLLMGGIHGDEPASVEALLELAGRVSSSAVAHPGELILVPGLNPDGLARGQKNAASDVDLNRNFPARNFATEHAPGYDPGPAPLSEPETALLARIVDEYRIDAVVAVHAPFACINFDGPAGEWAASVAAASGWPVRASIGYPTPGSLGSWLGVDRNLPILTVELPPGPLAGFREAAAAALDAACLRRPAATTQVPTKAK